MKRSVPVNAGSMADIAFLLLIFFLICTTINTDAGVPQKLAEPCLTEDCASKIEERNLLRIDLNENRECLVNDEIVLQNGLTQAVYDFIANKTKSESKPFKPGDAVISVSSSRETPYDFYVATMSKIKLAYAKVKNEYALEKFNKEFEALTKAQKKTVLEAIPEKIADRSL